MRVKTKKLQKGEIMKKKTLRVFETFSGIGAQRAALERLKEKIGLNYEIVATSDWFINAIECYDAIHFDGIPPIELPSYNEQLEELLKYTFSKDSVKPYDIRNMNREDLAFLYRAHKRTNNLGSILDIKSKDIPDCDLLTYSFPCQDLSTGGKTQGMGRNSGTRSGLLWQIERILKGLHKEKRLPEYLLMENVKAIKADSNKKDLDEWLSFLESIGYCNEECMILDASKFGVPQDRKRAFIVSHLKTPVNISEDKLKHNFDYKLSDFVHSSQGNPIYQREYDEAQLFPTISRQEMWNINGRQWKEDLVVHTITCNMDRSNTSVMFRYNGAKGDSFRLLTIREAFLLMGFTNREYESAAKLGLSYRQMNKLIGNSIVVNVLEEIFRFLFDGKYN